MADKKLKALIDGLSDAEWEKRKDAAQKLAETLKHGDGDARCSAADALGNVEQALKNGTEKGDETIDEVVEALATALKDRNHFVRQRAAKAMGTVGAMAVKHISQLEAACGDNNEYGRKAAKVSLALVKLQKAASFDDVEEAKKDGG